MEFYGEILLVNWKRLYEEFFYGGTSGMRIAHVRIALIEYRSLWSLIPVIAKDLESSEYDCTED